MKIPLVVKGLFMCFCLVSAAGYNNVEVAEFLLENGADVNAQDKGGLIPLHNASSYVQIYIYVILFLQLATTMWRWQNFF